MNAQGGLNVASRPRLRRGHPGIRLACALLLLGAWRCGGGEGAPAPALTAEALAKVFRTPAGHPWIIARDSGPFALTLRAPENAAWDLRGMSRVTLRAAREKAGLTVVRLRWALQSRAGGYYAATLPVIVPAAGAAEVVLALDADSAALAPAGHQRPWDALAAAEVIALELRAECSFAAAAAADENVKLALSNVTLEKARAASEQAVLLDVALLPPPPGWRAKATLRFRIEPPPADPWAAEGDADVRVLLPGGKQALAFCEQRHFRANDGSASRSVAYGPPYWLAHLPELPTAGVLEISSGARKWRIAMESALQSRDRQGAEPLANARGSDARGSDKGERWQPPLQTPVPATAEFCAGLPGPWVLDARGQWQPSAAPPQSGRGASGEGGEPGALWRPVPFWNADWGNFAGPLRPNAVLAGHMDALLAQSSAAGQSQPLVVLDGEGFERAGTFNWSSHPLKGVVAGPGELFRAARGVDFCRRNMRYCIARWGLAQAVSGFWLTPVLNAPGASEFYAKTSPLLNSWTKGLALPVIALHPFARAPEIERVVATFERDTTNWRVDSRLGAGNAHPVRGEGSDGGGCLEARAAARGALTVAAQGALNFPAETWKSAAPDNFSGADALQLDVRVPPDGPPDLRVGVHLRDRDGLWYEALLPRMPNPGDWTTYTLDITGANQHGLNEKNHRKPWNDYSRQRLTEVGLHVYSVHTVWPPDAGRRGAQPLSARFDHVRAVRYPLENPRVIKPAIALDSSVILPWGEAREISAPASGPAQLHPGDLWECRLTVNKTFANPFDAAECDLAAVITMPSGKQIRAPAFFDQPCERREAKPGGAEELEPAGPERFTVRYRVLESGPHQVVMELREGGRFDTVKKAWQPDRRFTPEGQPQEPMGRHWGRSQYAERYSNGRRIVETVRFVPGAVTASLKLAAPAFVVENAKPDTQNPKSPFRGFVRLAADGRHFQFDDGSFYYPLGPCVRSPSDSRIPYMDQKWNLADIDRYAKRGTYQYQEYFAAFEKAGINWARVWMCPWWCGLEWRRDWPGFQGCGRYNMLNAWRLDRLLADAERRGIFLDLSLTNHGQYSLHIDSEWQNNPYNAELGGPLAAPSEFFTRADPKAAHLNRLRYTIARFGHSPAIMGWALFSELEWTEEYEPSIEFREDDTPAPNIEAWHTEMAEFVKASDPNRHLVTTHYSHPVRGAGTLKLPAIDYATSNAYSAFEEFEEGKFDAAVALSEFWNGNTRHGLKGFRKFNKPALVEEQGRHWGGGPNNTKAQLDADLHAGLWGSLVQPLGGATGYWWWLHVHYDQRYGEYRALANFLQGEDLRPQKGEPLLEPAFLNVESSSGHLRGRALKSDRRAYAWFYHRATPLGPPVPAISGASASIEGLKPGAYSVEFWDTYAGTMIEKRDLTIGNAAAELALPPVKRDLAVKIKAK